MRNLSSAFAASLAGGATTLATLWKLSRRDGVTLGFTDHDRDLIIDGVTYAGRSGAQGSEIESNFDFAVGGGDLAGALTADGLSEIDLAKGLWDDAEIEMSVVDWTNPDARATIESGAIGEVRRHGASFSAELRSLAHRLDEERGRRFTANCSATLGDSRCGVNLVDWRRTASVTSSDGIALIEVAALAAQPDGLYRAGSLRWTSGANAGFAQDVRDHRNRAGLAAISLWTAPPRAISAGDAFEISAGCDKSFATCRDRFANAANFRGFPHMPGNDLLLRVARQGEANMDGGSLFR